MHTNKLKCIPKCVNAEEKLYEYQHDKLQIKMLASSSVEKKNSEVMNIKLNTQNVFIRTNILDIRMH